MGQTNVGQIFDDILNHRSTDGANHEIQDHYGLESNQLPLALLMREWPDELEARAVSPAPSDVAQNQASILPYVFPDSAAMFMHVNMPTVGVGEAVYPVITSMPAVATPAENATPTGTGIDSEGHSTAAFSADVLSPSRIQASFFYSREDRARFAGMDSSLRENLSMGLSDGLDKEIIAGTNGLLAGTNLANHNVTTETTYALYRDQFAFGRVDGRYASTAAALRILMGAATYAHAAAEYRGNSDNMDALMSLMSVVDGIRVSAHVPAVASTKQNAVIRLGSRGDMVAPVWDGIEIIPDMVTKAKSGQIVITAIMLHAVKVIREGGFHKQQTQHA